MATARFLAFLLCALYASTADGSGDDSMSNWPHWRGPLASGAAPRGNPPAAWSESSNIRWKFALPGSGHATPIVWNDRVYLQVAIPGDRPTGGEGPTAAPMKYAVLALDRATGKEIWRSVVREEQAHEQIHQDASQASASPLTDGERIYAYFGSRGLYCLDLEGRLLWGADFGDMQTRNHFGEGSSPAMHGDTLVVNWDHEGDDFLVALDKRTGDERWRVSRDEPTSWSTPLIVEHKGRAQVIVSATRRVCGYDLADGKLLWYCAGMTDNVIPSPVHADGTVYVTSGFRGNALFAIELDRAQGDVAGSPAIRWSFDKHTPYVPSPLLVGEHLYVLEHNRAVLTCFDCSTGKPLFGPERLEGIRGVYASPTAAGGRVYIAGRDGKTVVLKDGPKLEILATNTLDDAFDASPAIAGDELFLRGDKHLYCIAEK